MKGSKFDKRNKSPKYPQDATAFVKDEKNWKKIYTTVAQHASSRSQRMKFEDWQKEITLLYAKDRRDTMVMLMQLSFWYAALNKHLNDPDKLEELLKIFEERKKEPLDYRRNGVITIFVGVGIYILGFLALGNIVEGIGALVGLVGVGTLIAGYLYPNTGKELTDAVEEFEKK